MFIGFSRDFVTAILAYSALLGAFLIHFGMILALYAQRQRQKDKKR
jgi:hypothetical protein